jgi:hypothetical protein
MTQNKIPNSDIIGYEGPVGHEKAIHKYMHPAPGVKLRTTKDNGWTWIEIAPGRYKRVRKHDSTAS